MSNKGLENILKDIKNTTSQFNNLGGYKTCDTNCKLSLIKGGPLMLGGNKYLSGKWKDWRKTFDSSNSNSYKIQLALMHLPKFNYSVRYVDLPFRFDNWHKAHNYANEQFGGLKFQIMGSRDAAHWHKSGLDKNNSRSFKTDVQNAFLKDDEPQTGGSGVYNLFDSKEVIRNSSDAKDLEKILKRFNQLKIKKNSKKIKKLN